MIRIEGIPVVKARLRSPVRMMKRLPSMPVGNRPRVVARPSIDLPSGIAS